MSAYEIKGSFWDRSTAVVIIVILAIRTYQLMTLDEQYFIIADTDLPSYYVAVTNIALAVFVLVPLFVMYTLPAIHTTENIYYRIRLKSRESIIYRFLLLSLTKAAFVAVLVNITATMILLIKSPALPDLAQIALSAAATTILEILFFLVCAQLLLVVFALTGRIQIASIVVGVYVIGDFVADHIPFLAGSLPYTGWHLTEISLPPSLLGLAQSMLPLLLLISLLSYANLLVIRNRDLFLSNEAQRDA